MDEGARHRHALLLAARELRGVVVAAVAEADALEQRVAAPARVLAAQLERHLDVLARRERRDQVERLEHEADPRGAQPRALVLAQAREVVAVEQHAPARRAVEAREQAEQRALAAAGRTEMARNSPAASSNVISLRTVSSRPPDG